MWRKTIYSLENAVKANPLLTRYFALATILTLWLATRPYAGIIIDAQLYTFQAMARLDPSKFDGDLYLKFGSQDNFTVYGYLLSRAVSLLGVVAANFWMTVLGGILWLAAALFLTRTLFPAFSYRVLAMWGVLVLAAGYGGGFTYGQQYQSPRLYVEAIVLVAIALALRRAWWRSCAALAVGLVIHPLMILSGVGVVFVLAALERRWLWLLPLIGLAAMTGLTILGVQPFVRIDQFITGEWWTIVRQRSHNEFLSGWHLYDYLSILVQVNLAVLAYGLGNAAERRLFKAIALVICPSLLVSAVGADWLHDLLIVNVQLYRVIWILAVFANLFAGIVFLRLQAQAGTSRHYVIFGLALYVIERFIPVELLLVCPFLLVASLALLWEGQKGRLSNGCTLILFSIACIVGMVTAIILVLQVQFQIAFPDHNFYFLDVALTITTLTAAVLFSQGYRIVACWMVGAALITGALNFDQRSQWERFVESGGHPPSPILAMLKTAKNIYWEDGLNYLWFDLQQPSYYSGIQGVGAMFYQKTAFEYRHRSEILSRLNTTDFSHMRVDNGDYPSHETNENGPSRADLEYVCQTLPDLDVIVLFSKIPNARGLEWNAPAPQYVEQVVGDGTMPVERLTEHYFYTCDDFRAAKLKPASAAAASK